ncbi:MAG: alpha/beta fold hydrolase [Puniceicoccales bacterium]|jgi:haloalkane dehalogenase|nr:alpha/beta fold hydrolase [Puniceicoccales bacterium]
MKMLPKELKKIYPFRSHFLNIGGKNRIHYVDEGEGDAVVMFHGNPTWSFYYRNLIEGLQSSFRCIAVDNVGCGLSDKPQNYPYRLENHIQNAQKVVEFLQLDRFHLVMHDWGCAIGMALAENFPERIASLTIMNGAAFHSSQIPDRIALCKIPLLGSFLIRGLNAFVLCSNSMATARGLDSKVSLGYKFPYNSWKNRVAIKKFVDDIPLHSGHPSWGTLTKIQDQLFLLSQRKILLLWGGEDFCFTESFLNEWQQFFPKAKSIIYENCGHYVLEDMKDEAIAEIRQFLTAAKRS